jgi:Tol biopolymer transport system component
MDRRAPAPRREVRRTGLGSRPRPSQVSRNGPLRQYDAATLFKNVAVIAAGFSHDGTKALVSMDASGVFNLYAIPTAGGTPQRLVNHGYAVLAVNNRGSSG